MTYTPPVADMAYLLENVIGFKDLPQSEDLDLETIEAILSEAAKLASDV